MLMFAVVIVDVRIDARIASTITMIDAMISLNNHYSKHQL
jgi:hypothetical protein